MSTSDDKENDTQTKSAVEESITAKLRSALKQDGDFPVRARIVSKLQALAFDPNTTVDQVAELILKSPALGTRVLHLVNSAFFHGRQPLYTVSQAVMRIGMQSICDLCSGFVLMQRFIPAATHGEVFADNISKCIVSSLSTSRLLELTDCSKMRERGYLASTFCNLGNLLLAFYFPPLYQAAASRAVLRRCTISQSLHELLGITALDLNLAVIGSLEIPDYYRKIMIAAEGGELDMSLEEDSKTLIQILQLSHGLSECLVDFKDRELLLEHLSSSIGNMPLGEPQVIKWLSELPQVFSEHCKMIELPFLHLPDFLDSLYSSASMSTEGVPSNPGIDTSEYDDRLKALKQAVDLNSSHLAVLGTALEVLVYGLKCPRAILLTKDVRANTLLGRIGLGDLGTTSPSSLCLNLRTLGKLYPAIDQAISSGTVQICPKWVDGRSEMSFVLPFGPSSKAEGTIIASVPTEFRKDVSGAFLQRTTQDIKALLDSNRSGPR